MEKRELKFYETPAVEVVEMKMEGILCVSVDFEDGEGGWG